MLNRKEFERVTPESVGVSSADIEWLFDQLESGFTEPHGLMLMKHGKIIAEGWWSPYAPGIRHGLQSHSKTYAATAVGVAYSEGLLTLDERIIDIFPEKAPESPSQNLKKLTVHDVLCMGCGMDEMPNGSGDWIRDFLHTPVVHIPGTTYMYNSVGSALLCAIVRKKTNMDLYEYLKPRLFDKIGILADNHKWMRMPDGCEAGGFGLYATLEDNLRLMKLYADGGIWDGERILAADYVEKAISNQNDSASEEKNNPPAKDNFVGYGYQIWMCRPTGVYRADGAMGQFTIVVPEDDMIIAITESAPGHWAQKTLDVMWEFLDKLHAHKEDRPQSSYDRLAKRMRCLSLPAPSFAPFSPIANKISEKRWKVKEGTLHFCDVGLPQFMCGQPFPAPVEALSFAFLEDRCVLHYTVGGNARQIIIGMDGSRKENVIEGGIATRALVSGAWKTESGLEVKFRYIETCMEITLVFHFESSTVTITGENSFIFSPDNPSIVAELSEENK